MIRCEFALILSHRFLAHWTVDVGSVCENSLAIQQSLPRRGQSITSKKYNLAI